MESNSLKCSNIQTVRSIELKFGMYSTGHRRTNPIDFGEYWMREYKKEFLYITAYGVKFF